ncbi:MAG: septum formation initiator family protein, partial [Actinomycetota bacterium]|nr:septum formation initiator family protein [Actinomycetota bacterium]
ARSRTAPAEPRQSTAWVRGAILASILVMLAVTIVPTARSVIRQRSQISALQDTISAQQADVTQRQAELARWNDPAYVEQQARERLKFVRPGERSYGVIDPPGDKATVPSGTTVAAPQSSSNRPWYGQMWQSVQLADRPSAGMAPVAR